MDKAVVKTLVCNELASFIVEKYINKYGNDKFNKVKPIFVGIAVEILLSHLNKQSTMDDDWKEAEYPRDKSGQFTSGGSSTGGAASIKSNPYKNKKIAGQKCGKPMTFEQANGGKVNPTGDLENCYACLAVFEARLRGFDIEALPKNKISQKANDFLSHKIYEVFYDEKTGKPPKAIQYDSQSINKIEKWLDSQIKPNQRFAFIYFTDSQEDGHIINIIKDKQGRIKYYDPQLGSEMNNKIFENIAFEKINKKGELINTKPVIFRTDDKIINTVMIEDVAKPANTLGK